MCCEVAFNKGEKIEIELLQNSCIDVLDKIKLLNKESVINIHSYDIGPVYPGYFVGHELELNRVNGKLGQHRNLCKQDLLQIMHIQISKF